MSRLPIPGEDRGSWGDVLNDYLRESHTEDGSLKANSVGSTQLQPNSVTASAVAPNSISTTQLASNSVTAAIIADGSINEAQLSTSVQSKLDAVAGGIADGSVSSAKLADNAVTLPKLSSDIQTSLTSASTAVQSINGKSGGSISLTKTDISLGNVDNTSDSSKPISNATQIALDLKVATSSLAPVATSGSYADLTNKPTIPVAPVSSVAGRTGAVTLTSSDVGLTNVNNTSDMNKPISAATQTALDLKVSAASLATVATSGLYTDLINKPNFSTVATTGSYADLTSKPALSTVATSGSYTDLINKPTIPATPVTSVAGRTGNVTLTSSDVGLPNVDNTSDANKPVSAAQQIALNLKANVADVYTVAATNALFIQTVNGTGPDGNGNVIVTGEQGETGEPGPVGPYAPYSLPVYILAANQTISNLPSDFPDGGLVFQKTS